MTIKAVYQYVTTIQQIKPQQFEYNKSDEAIYTTNFNF
jgi:hypothetical protein